MESSQHAVGHAYALAPSHARHLRTHVSSHARIFARTKGRDAYRCSGSENERLLSPKFGSGSQVRRKVRAARRPTGARARHQAAAVRVLHGFQEVVGEGELLQPTPSYLSDSLTLEKKGCPAQPYPFAPGEGRGTGRAGSGGREGAASAPASASAPDTLSRPDTCHAPRRPCARAASCRRCS